VVQVVVLQLLQQHRIGFCHLLEHIGKLLEIIANEAIASEASLSINNEVVLFLVEYVVRVKICV
jgi:hypothetical protein